MPETLAPPRGRFVTLPEGFRADWLDEGPLYLVDPATRAVAAVAVPATRVDRRPAPAPDDPAPGPDEPDTGPAPAPESPDIPDTPAPAPPPPPAEAELAPRAGTAPGARLSEEDRALLRRLWADPEHGRNSGTVLAEFRRRGGPDITPTSARSYRPAGLPPLPQGRNWAASRVPAPPPAPALETGPERFVVGRGVTLRLRRQGRALMARLWREDPTATAVAIAERFRAASGAAVSAQLAARCRPAGLPALPKGRRPSSPRPAPKPEPEPAGWGIRIDHEGRVRRLGPRAAILLGRLWADPEHNEHATAVADEFFRRTGVRLEPGQALKHAPPDRRRPEAEPESAPSLPPGRRPRRSREEKARDAAALLGPAPPAPRPTRPPIDAPLSEAQAEHLQRLCRTNRGWTPARLAREFAAEAGRDVTLAVVREAIETADRCDRDAESARIFAEVDRRVAADTAAGRDQAPPAPLRSPGQGSAR